MSKRDALRDLSRKFPAPKEIASLFVDLFDEPDRVVAIVASAIAESFLERMIIAKLKHKDSSYLRTEAHWLSFTPKF
jgi:hypothetical protein